MTEGRLAIAETLTADVTGISDPDGPANPDFTYQWIRVDADGAETEIAGATNNAYTVDAADAGNRLMIRVVFIDNDGTEETLTSPATSYVPHQTRILIKKSGQISAGSHDVVGLSQGFSTAAADLKHRIESARMSVANNLTQNRRCTKNTGFDYPHETLNENPKTIRPTPKLGAPSIPNIYPC